MAAHMFSTYTLVPEKTTSFMEIVMANFGLEELENDYPLNLLGLVIVVHTSCKASFINGEGLPEQAFFTGSPI
ncbi:hypothetical protein QJS10_CPB04g01405 [Acorus calamus]|uniref:Uncharacterized protein n=1 Tax=Acorus calamus TaxID=4465 RepID=A0AAV9EZB9_ACOCL|nr:hypothetical protein QJS10_CPB04g01405 [Acorus calamus]